MLGTRMTYWLAQACLMAREEAGKKQSHVAAALDMNQSSVYRFELGGSWVRDADRFVNAYAQVVGLDDPRQIWDRALALWHQHGANPFEENGSLSGFREAIGSVREPARREARAEPKRGSRGAGPRSAAG